MKVSETNHHHGGHNNDNGFKEEKQHIDELIKKYKHQIDSEISGKSGQQMVHLQHVLSDPLASSYFLSFMSLDFTTENLLCYFELQSLLDYLEFAEKKVIWKIETTSTNTNTATTGSTISGIFGIVNNNSTIDNLENESQSHGFSNNNRNSASSSRLSIASSSVGGSGNYSVQKTLESREMIQRAIKFRKRFLESNSQHEINLPGKVKEKVLDFLFQVEVASVKFDQALENQEQIEMIKEFASQLRNSLNELKLELLKNLQDPFARFTTSDLYYECFALFLSSQGDDSFHRNRLLNANSKDKMIVLNQPSEDDERLVQMSKKLELLETKHPLTVVKKLLEQLQQHLSMKELYVVVPQQQQDNNNTRKIDLNFEKLNDEFISMWDHFILETFALNNVNLDLIKDSEEEKLTFFLNLYNLLLIHAVCSVRSLPLLEISKVIFFSKTHYRVGGYLFSLSDIYEGVLQRNSPKNILFGRRFNRHDPRGAFSLKTANPTIFFGVIDLTLYSPRLQIYEPSTVYQQLEENAVTFFSKNCEIIKQQGNTVVTLPQTFKEKLTDLKTFSEGSSSGSRIINKKEQVVVENLLFKYLPEEKKKLGLQAESYEFSYSPNKYSPPNWIIIMSSDKEKEICDHFKLDCESINIVPTTDQQQEQKQNRKLWSRQHNNKKSLYTWQFNDETSFQKSESSIVDKILLKKNDSKCTIC